jgi:hypothetical protein
MVVTNVPGPPFPLYAMGAEMPEAFPIVPLAGNLTLGVAVLSYNGALNLGVTADTTGCPDVDAFVTGVDRSFAQLGAVADPSGRESCRGGFWAGIVPPAATDPAQIPVTAGEPLDSAVS